MATYAEIWKTLSAVDVSKHIEKKQNLSYLSWAWAWGVLMEHYPQATYVFHDVEIAQDGSATVSVTVSIDGCGRTMWLPVMDHRNAAVKQPDSRKISDSKMRCLVKCLAMFGLGHYIYAGEDLPEAPAKIGSSAIDTSVEAFTVLDDEEKKFLQDTAMQIIGEIKDDNIDSAYKYYKSLDNEEKLAMWHLLPSNIRSAIKTHDKKLQSDGAKP